MASRSTSHARTLCEGNVDVLPDEFFVSKLSDVSKSRKPSPIWDLFSVESEPGIISMLAGKPNPATFPFEHISLGIKPTSSSVSHPCADHEEVTQMTLQGDDLTMALQYNLTAGIPELVEWMRGMMEEVHLGGSSGGEKDASWRVSLGHGSQDLLYKAFCALLNPGDTIIVEGPTYPTIIPILDALRCNYAIVDSDEDGMSASSLASVLGSWYTNPSTAEKPFPKVIYTVPFGSNPAGVTTSLPRRREILRLARKFDLIILEDDPYYFLYYGDGPRPASYFTLDRLGKAAAGDVAVQDDGEEVDERAGRVLRMDSFSKIISAGFRLGWVTGPSVLVKAIDTHSASTVVQPSSLSQMVVLKLLQAWGREGFLAHAERTAAFYRERRDAMAKSLERHFVNVHGEPSAQKEGPHRPAAEWIVPDASMFFWVKLHLPNPDLDITSFVRSTAVPRGILALPGSAAFPEERKTGCVRLSVQLALDEEVEEGCEEVGGGGIPIVQVDGTPLNLRDSRVSLAEVAIAKVEESADSSPLSPSSLSHHSADSASTLHPPDTATTLASASGQAEKEKGLASSEEKSQFIPTRNFAMRLRRASSTIGLKFKSLTKSPSTARLTGILKMRRSVGVLSERADAQA